MPNFSGSLKRPSPFDDTSRFRSSAVVRSAATALIAFLLLGASATAQAPAPGSAAAGVRADRPFRILHVMSYHSPWVWTDEQIDGFKEGLGNLPIEFRVFQMDTKRHSDEAWKQRVGREARRLVEEWNPHLLYTSDDNAQEYVARNYVGTALPIVFSAVNAAPEDYGFASSPNVTGVLELEHSVQTLRLLRKIVPGVRRIAVIIDEDPTWPGVVARMKENLPEVPEVEVVSWDLIRTFAEYKRKVAGYQGTIDALGLLGIFTFTDENGANVPYQDVLRWTAENSTLPDFSFWRDRVDFGTLCSVTVWGYEQGRLAGEMARKVLTGESSPSEIPITRTAMGVPVVSLARAKRLGIKIPASVLLSSEVITDFLWDRQ